MTEYDVVVIGAGPGGYPAAIRAAQLGSKVAIIEANGLGGVCLNQGCIPTKSLLAGSSRFAQLSHLHEYGIEASEFYYNSALAHERKEKIISQLQNGIQALLKKNKIDLIRGEGSLKDANTIEIKKGVDTSSVKAKNIILATGSSPADIGCMKADHKRILNSNDILKLKGIPKSIAIIGGGVIGCEFATYYNEIGADVTIIEQLPNLLGLLNIDTQIIRRFESILKRKGIKLLLGKSVQKVLAENDKTIITLSEKESVETEYTLISVGRKFNTASLNLISAAIEIDAIGSIPVNESMQTNVPNIYAIGDITNKSMLAHTATRQGIIAAHKIHNKTVSINYANIPWCIYSHPEIASVGLSEQAMKETNAEYDTGTYFYRALGRAAAEGEPEGLLKLIAEKDTGKILGAQIFGHAATELIHIAAVLIENELGVEALTRTVFAHPTFSEIFFEAGEDILGIAIHK